ncbi:hypothetical protein K435DRAFT_863823 [Dendrothele bispora CBS 962.96]|uniref:Uncharacterized protein n=1 Tax=Dendrothele bispora (strain CBS 962.96) TaxID=1314807 RepID=A0A4S8KZU7_DENBC|nr:hypothetical protein K435DRAFT_873165 [Dendrothele bispora CBS 962.96]THU90969.1 hypothetical protein K435DRAFT_863823 [Dendrothele bispora CBS 962.96]
MSARPKPKHSRPNSAVYIGSDPLLHKLASTPPGIPDLPEPPDSFERDFDNIVEGEGDEYADESENDRESGLPSPPATNSTGSGSTGDPASIALRGSRRVTTTTTTSASSSSAAKRTSNSIMLNENNVKTFHKAFSSNPNSTSTLSSRNTMDDDDYDNSNIHNAHVHETQQQQQQQQNQYDLGLGMDDDDADLDGDGDDCEEGEHTAKLLRRQSLRSPTSTTSSSDNSQALERVKSLTERNRLALDKLSSISRLSSPSPKPIPLAFSSSSSSSSNRPASASGTRLNNTYSQHHHQNNAAATAAPDRSGSETERESVRGESSSSQTRSRHSLSPDIPNYHNSSSNSGGTMTRGAPSTPRTQRTRLISAPASPAKALQLRAAASSSSSSNSNTHSHYSGSGTGSVSPMSSPNKARKRASMPMSDLADFRSGGGGGGGRRVRSPSPNGYGHAYDYETPSRSRADDIAARALEAVASSRRGGGGGGGATSGLNGAKTRQPLPREFREASMMMTASGSSRGSDVERSGGGSVSRRSSVSSRNREYEDDGYEEDVDRREKERRVNGRYSTEPTTPHRDRSHLSRPSLNLSPRLQRNLNNSLGINTNDRATIGRSSTLASTSSAASSSSSVRRQGHGHQTRWYSEDMSSSSSVSRDHDDDDDEENENEDDLTGPIPHATTAVPGGRKPVVRATGSADSVLTMTTATPSPADAGSQFGSRVIGGSGSKTLGRNAGRGLGVGGGRDVFDDTPLRDRDRAGSRLGRDRDRDRAGSRLGRHRDGDGERSVSRNTNRSRSRVGWEDESYEDERGGGGEGGRGGVSYYDDGEEDEYGERKGRSSRAERELRTRAGTIVGPRASTSMADFQEYRARSRERDGDVRDRERESSMVRLNGRDREPRDEPLTAPPQLRSYNSSYPLPLGRGLERMDREKERERDRAPSAMSSNHTKTPSSRGDHLRLLHEALRLFESNVSRMPSTTSASVGDLLRNAQLIVSASERLGVWLRESNQRALENQIDAEVEVDANNNTNASDAVAEVWRRVGGEYRDGTRVSDELVRAVTDFLLGVGRAVKDMNPSPVDHGRSVSLDEVVARARSRTERERGSMSPEGILDGTGVPRSGSGGSGTGGRTGGKGSTGTGSGAGSRPASAFNLRERDRDLGREERYETPPQARAGSRQALNGVTPSTGGSTTSSSVSVGRVRHLATLDSQETIHGHDYEPSPTPASRGQNQNSNNTRNGATLDRSRTLPPISIPKPLGTLPSEATKTPATSRRLPNNTSGTSKTISSSSTSVTRRKTTTGVHSATVRGAPFPGLSTPNLPTTQLTTHTASGSRITDSPMDSRDPSSTKNKLAFPLVRSDSEKSGGSGDRPRSTVTFSRSSSISVNALTGLQQQFEQDERDKRDKRRLSISGNRRRAESGASASGEEPPPSASRPRGIRSDTEDLMKRRQTGTLGRQIRMSLDGSIGREAGLDMGMGVSVSSTASTVHPADRSAALTSTGPRRERRGTVVDLWPRGS